MNKKIAAIILAAGKGKRMKSDLPKVLHKINGKPLVQHLLDTLATIKFDRIVIVIGHKGEMVINELKGYKADFVWQREQLGTGHAVQMAEELLSDFDGTVLVAAGDVPFLSAESIQALISSHAKSGASATCLTADFDNPKGYGRIIRRPGTDILAEIIEEKDANDEVRRIKEINSGTFCFDAKDLFWALKEVKNSNAQKEYYLTDTIKILGRSGRLCCVWKAPDPLEISGVNSAEELAVLERSFLAKKNEHLSPR